MRGRRLERTALASVFALSAVVATACASSGSRTTTASSAARPDTRDTTASAYNAPRTTRNRSARVSRVTEEDVKRAGNMNLVTFIESHLAGVRVNTSRGEYLVTIVGVGSQTNPGALVLIDGTEGSLSGLNLQDVTSMEVLKDSGAAVYGVRGGNGVLLITTKKK